MEHKLVQRARGVEQSKIREVTRLIERKGGINLGQGTCALPPDPRVLEAAQRAIAAGRNSYTLFDGIPELKVAIAGRYAAYNQMPIGPENVLVTCGATGAFESICKCFLDPGDEVVVLEPTYQYHVRQVLERGAVPRFVRLHPPHWRLIPEELERVITPKIKLLVMSNPNNPTGKVFTRQELQTIGDICRRADVVAVSDEVYEYIVAKDRTHVSLASLPGMFEHTLTMSSASKTLFVTGWRVGWAVGPGRILRALGIKSDETYVCAPAPLQYAVAESLALGDEFFEKIRDGFQRKRAQICTALSEGGFTPRIPDGAYYVLAGYERFGFDDDNAAVTSLIEQVGIAAVPGKSFFPSAGNTGMLRFCFSVEDGLLNEACHRLKSALERVHVSRGTAWHSGSARINLERTPVVGSPVALSGVN